MIGWFIGGAVDLTWTIEYAVQTRRNRIFFKWLFPLTRLGDTESGIDSHVFGVIAIVSTLVTVVSALAVAISGFRSARFT